MGQTDGRTDTVPLHSAGLVAPHNNNNNNNSHDNVYGAVIMTKVIARVHAVHLMNADTERRVAANP